MSQNVTHVTLHRNVTSSVALVVLFGVALLGEKLNGSGVGIIVIGSGVVIIALGLYLRLTNLPLD